MVTGIVLINVDRVKLKEVIDGILNIDGVTEVCALAGEYDLAAIIRVADHHQLSDIIINKMLHNISGIIHSKTLVALQTHSKFDLKSIFGAKN